MNSKAPSKKWSLCAKDIESKVFLINMHFFVARGFNWQFTGSLIYIIEREFFIDSGILLHRGEKYNMLGHFCPLYRWKVLYEHIVHYMSKLYSVRLLQWKNLGVSSRRRLKCFACLLLFKKSWKWKIFLCVKSLCPKGRTASPLLKKVKPCSAGLLLGWVTIFESPV